jgi:hypothetical protein
LIICIYEERGGHEIKSIHMRNGITLPGSIPVRGTGTG